MRIAWFSPMPPDRSGIAAYSAEILPWLQRTHCIDVFVDRPASRTETSWLSAHDFIWKHRRDPYDLTVYQMGNDVCHGYMWAYLFRYPGLLVLHDAQLHQARAAWLMKRYQPRFDDYIAEFRSTETAAPPEAAAVIAAGLGQPAFYQYWPLLRLVLERSRLTLVHTEWLRRTLAERYAARIDAIPMGVADPLATAPSKSRDAIRARHGIPADARVIAAYGGITPEKRIESILRAAADLGAKGLQPHVLLVGEEAGHYDVRADAARAGISDRVHITGYVADDELPAYLAAADVCACLRWPTNRETSASWLRCLAAGKATVITDLAQHVDLPEIAIRIDVLDEERALPEAFTRLLVDDLYRDELGRAARAYWEAHHQLQHMADAYERALGAAASLPDPRVTLPPHITTDGGDVLREIAAETGAVHALGEFIP